MARLDGRMIRLELDGNYLLGVTDSSFERSVDMIDITNYESNSNKEFLPGERGSTISATFTLDSTLSNVGFDDIVDGVEAGTLYAFVYGDSTASTGTVITGSCYISAYTLNGSKNDVATVDATLQVTGAIVRDTAS